MSSMKFILLPSLVPAQLLSPTILRRSWLKVLPVADRVSPVTERYCKASALSAEFVAIEETEAQGKLWIALFSLLVTIAEFEIP